MEAGRPARSDGTRGLDAALLLGLAAVGVGAIALRAWGLGHLPGINGDEAWFGVQMQELRSGQPAWRTPTGNPLNPFHAGPVFLLQLFFEPRFWILRLPALLTGIALPPLTFLLVRRVCDETTGLLAAILAAGLPVNVVYSRLGWDPSQSALAALLVLFCAARRSAWGLAAALLVAVVVHPTNVFLVPVALCVMVGAVLGEADGERRERWRALAPLAAVVLPAVAFVLLASRGGARAFRGVFERLFDAGAWAQLALGSSRLLSGVSVYEFVAGPLGPAATLAHDVGAAALLLSVLPAGIWLLWRRRDWRSLAWPVGLLLGLVVFFVVAGPSRFEPRRTRHVLWLVTPATLAFAVCARALLPGSRARRAGLAAALVLAAACLASAARYVLVSVIETGGEAALAFRTAAVEPKARALDIVLRDARGAATILAEDWWLFWPLRYRAAAHEGVSVWAMRFEGHRDDVRQVLESGGYAVGFVGGRIHRYVYWSYRKQVREWIVDDYGGRPLLGVWRLEGVAAPEAAGELPAGDIPRAKP